MNFIRKERRQKIATLDESLDLRNLSHHSLHPDFVHIADDSTRHRVSREVARLPMEVRLPTKLFFGLELGIDELEALLDRCEDPQGVADFLRDYRTRRARVLEKRRKLQDKLRHLNHKIHMLETREDVNREALLKRCLNRKKSYLHRMQLTDGIYKYQELAELLGKSKSTILRRIRKAQEFLRTGLLESEEATDEELSEEWNMQGTA